MAFEESYLKNFHVFLWTYNLLQQWLYTFLFMRREELALFSKKTKAWELSSCVLYKQFVLNIQERLNRSYEYPVVFAFCNQNNSLHRQSEIFTLWISLHYDRKHFCNWIHLTFCIVPVQYLIWEPISFPAISSAAWLYDITQDQARLNGGW